MLGGELVGLLLEEQLEGSLRQSVCRSRGDLLEGSEVHIESGPIVAEGPLRDDLSPPGGEFVEFPEFLGREAWRRHGSSGLAVASVTDRGFPIRTAKQLQTPDKP